MIKYTILLALVILTFSGCGQEERFVQYPTTTYCSTHPQDVSCQSINATPQRR